MVESRRALVMTCVAALLMVLLYILLTLLPQPAAYDASQDQISLISINPVDVRSAGTRLGIQRHTYEQLDGTWYRDGEPADYNATDLTITFISYLYSDNLVTAGTNDLKIYGLEEPVAEAYFETFSDDRYRILFGIETVDGKSRYMMLEDKSEVYTVPVEAFDVIFEIKEERNNEDS